MILLHWLHYQWAILSWLWIVKYSCFITLPIPSVSMPRQIRTFRCSTNCCLPLGLQMLHCWWPYTFPNALKYIQFILLPFHLRNLHRIVHNWCYESIRINHFKATAAPDFLPFALISLAFEPTCTESEVGGKQLDIWLSKTQWTQCGYAIWLRKKKHKAVTNARK